jgi:hypothetical protein
MCHTALSEMDRSVAKYYVKWIKENIKDIEGIYNICIRYQEKLGIPKINFDRFCWFVFLNSNHDNPYVVRYVEEVLRYD